MEHQINEEIRDKEVRLISNDGEQLGIVAIQKAQELRAGGKVVELALLCQTEDDARAMQQTKGYASLVYLA